MNAVRQLARAELMKLRTTRTLVGLALGAAALTVLGIVLTVTSVEGKDLEGTSGVRDVLGALGGNVALFSLCLGVTSMAGEERHGLLAESLMAAPGRWPLWAAKALVCGAAGALIGLFVCLTTIPLASVLMGTKDAGFAVTSDLPGEVVLGCLVAGAAFAAFGVALGSVIRDQTWAITAGVTWVMVLDRLALSQAPDVGRVLPGGGLAAATGAAGEDLLGQGQGILLLAGYVLLLGAVGITVLRRRDVA